jgi:hypothetical protein
VLVVLDLHRVLAFLQADVNCVQFAGRVMPLVYEQFVIHPQPDAVVHPGVKAIGRLLQFQRMGPEAGEIVRREAGCRRAWAPVEIHVPVVAHQDGTPLEFAVVKIFALPVRVLLDSLPPQLGHGSVGVLVVLHSQTVMAIAQSDFRYVGGGGTVMPLVNDRLSIHPQPDAIVNVGVEAIEAAAKVQIAAPAHREPVSGQPRAGRTIAPVEVNADIVADQNRGAGERRVVVVFGPPLGDDRCSGGWDGSRGKRG